jgi:hypothetical protein
MQLWGSLTQQFQQIAGAALQEVAKQAAAMPQGAANPGATGTAAKSAAAPKAAKKAGPHSR